MKFKFCLLVAFLSINYSSNAQFSDTTTHYLRNGETREWGSFPAVVKDSQLTVRFDMKDAPGAGTLSLTQYDVNQIWKVTLNNKHLGNLELDEKKMVKYFEFENALLKSTDNVLTIVPEPVSANRSDDIVISNISIATGNKVGIETPVVIEVVEFEKTLVPSRITIVNRHGALEPVTVAPGDTLAARTGVIYSSTGIFSFSIPQGEYKVYASRGFEYGVDSMTLNATTQTPVHKRLTVKHEVSLPNWKGMDPHVHTREFSGHGDASMNERMITIAGEGLAYAVITEHNKAIDITDRVKALRLDKWFAAITGDELTTPVGHFNIFPATPGAVPAHDVKSWREVKQSLDRVPGKKVVILNHARDGHAGVRPSDSLHSRSVTVMPANAMEVMNSGSQQSDPRQLYMDWLSLLGKGIKLTPVGSSDSHDVSRFIVGQSRTYVRADGDLTDNFLAGRANVSFGLLTEMQVDAGDDNKLNVLIKVYAPSWITPTNVVLYANGQKIHSTSIRDQDRQVGNYYSKELTLVRPPHDLLLVAVGEGPDPKVPWWPIARPYSWTSPDVTPIVLGISEVISIVK